MGTALKIGTLAAAMSAVSLMTEAGRVEGAGTGAGRSLNWWPTMGRAQRR